jgi:predicted enzyme related to lactoylglutathione lyase
MPTREKAIIGAPCWVDLTTTDPERSRAFYTALLGWTVEDPNPEFGGYANFRKDGVLAAGVFPSQDGAQSVWSTYLATDDADKTLAAVAAHGGQSVFGPHQVGDLGRMAGITDPDGAFVGVWQPARHQGFGVVAESGAPAWFELHTRAYDRVLDFYRAVFGWPTSVMSDTAEFRYTTLQGDDGPLAGVMAAEGFLPDGVPSHWAVYFQVDDTDAAVDKAVELGGSVVQAAMDTPYGRLAHLADPTGAQFRLIAELPSTPAAG